MKKVSLITDGSCLNNPGRGGWACLFRFDGVKGEELGFDSDTTNNRMELMAPIQGLLAPKELALKEPCEVEITSDSKYVVQG
jgi:ribonuclease HI